MNDSPESIVSFEVVPQGVVVYNTASGAKMNKVVTEHVIALDSNGKLWVRLVDGFGDEVLSWNCLNSQTPKVQSNIPTRAEILCWLDDQSWGSDDYLGRVASILEEALAHWSS